MFKPTLENKILGLVIAAIGISLTVFVYLDIQEQTRSLLEQNQARVDMLSSAVVASIQSIMLSGKGDFAYQLVDSMKKVDYVEKLRVFDRQGTEVLVQNEDQPPSAEESFLAREVARTGTTLQFHETEGGKELLTQLKPLPNDEACQHCHTGGEAVRGIVSVSTSMEGVKEEIRSTQIRMLATSLLAFAAITVTLRFLVRMTIVNPIGAIVAAMKEIAHGNLNKTVERKSKDEIGDLVDNFNVMTQNLRESQENLQRSNAELEANSHRLVDLNQQLQHHLEEVSALSAVAAAISHSLDLSATLDSALRKILEVLQAQEGCIYLVDEQSGEFLMQVAQPSPPERSNGKGSGYLEKIMPTIPTLKQPVVFSGETSSGDGSAGQRNMAAVPLQSKKRLLGVMCILASEDKLSPDKIGLMTAIGDQLGVAIENAKLLQEASEVKVLRDLDALKSEFVARASHELRTPVTSIKGFAETLLRNDAKLTPQLRQEFIEGINRTSDRLTRLIQDILNLSKIEAGRLEIARDEIALRPVVRDVVQQFRHQNPRHSFVIEVERDFPHVLADRDRLSDVLTNLLSNAIAYSPDGGPVTIRAQQEGDQAVLSVGDHGVGIPPEELQHLFERYYRVDNISSRPVGGTGLGLYICRTYLEAMGSRIWVDSKLGEGSTFSFNLPLASRL